MRHILRVLLGVVIALVCIVVLLVGSIFAAPQLWINRKTLDIALMFARTSGIDVYLSSDTTLRARSVSFGKKQVELTAGRICFSLKEPNLAGCFSPVKLVAETNLLAIPPELTRVPVLKLGDGRIVGKVTASETKSEAQAKPAAEEGESEGLPVSLIERLRPRDLEIVLKSFRWEEYQGKKMTAWLARGTIKGDGRSLDLDVSGEHNDPKMPLKMQAKLAMADTKGQIDGSVRGLTDAFHSIGLQDCRFEWKRGAEDFSDLTTSLDCPIVGRLVLHKPPARKVRGWTGDLVARIRGQAELKSRADKLKGDWRIEVSPTGTRAVEGNFAIGLVYDGDLSKSSDLQNWKSKLDGALTVPDYGRLVAILDSTKFAVPSPLRNLEGTLQLSLNGESKQLSMAKGEIPFTLKTELRSPVQRVPIQVIGGLQWQEYEKGYLLNLDLTADLSGLTLRLPDLNPTDMPRLIPDPRIVMESPDREPAVSSTKFTYAIGIKTRSEDPIKLISNLGKEPVPLLVNLDLASGKPMRGAIQLSPVTLEVFRRKGTVKKFIVSLVGTDEPPRLDGKVDVESGDYIVHILITGPTDSPRVVFESDPPLSQDDALSVLLFGRTEQELSMGQGDTLASTRAAMSNRALSLASMYLLASTPIESVQYDPTTKTVTARLRVADGTTVQVGSDMEKLSELGVRRRLGSNFFINTYLKNPFESSEKRSVSSFLEWMSRY